jgi:type I restriction enzyme M protein
MDDPKSDILFLVVKKFEEFDFLHITSIETGYIFEHLIYKFAEASNETAGEHFTPREIIRLMVNILFLNDREILTTKGIVKTLYDPACGTGGMLSISEEYLNELNPDASLVVFGQEINPESYAICKSDMLIKGQYPANIKFGNSFTVDGLEYEKFDYMLSNPPFGVEWRKSEKIIKLEYDTKGFAGRFGAGLPRINDSSLLFLQHMISKMKPEDGGSRIGIVFNGSPLFTGSAGSGESEIRKWIIENDMLEAIIAMPDQLFYNAGIATYIWIVTNRKTPERKGKIQLINASGNKNEEEGRKNRFWSKMTKSLGNKRKEIHKEAIDFVTNIYGNFRNGAFCKIFPNEYFGYWRITVEQPLRDEKGNIIRDARGNPKPDANLRDYENIPFLMEKDGKLKKQKIEEYFDREVKPHVPDAWIDDSKTKTGYEMNFTKYFYEFKPLRPLEEIRRDILALEKETDGMIREVIN